MRILYLSVHEVLEYNECRMFTDMGFEVFSLGAYTMPGGQKGRKRPPIDGMPYDPHFVELALQYSKEDIHPDMLDGIDVVIVMHKTEMVNKNWPVFSEFIKQGGRVIWRSIGQSVPEREAELYPARVEGLEMVRYSPMEATIPGNIGCDALIRFGVDESDFLPWVGDREEVVNFTQSLTERAQFVGKDWLMESACGLPFKVYGPNNENLSGLAGGLLSHEAQLETLAHGRAYLYHGTYPASYTLSFIEAWMAGIPVVSVGPGKGNGPHFHFQSTFEQLIDDGVDGFMADSTTICRNHLVDLLDDSNWAAKIGMAGRRRAIQLFGKEVVQEQWREFLVR
jgi:hypothetical protein